jgi:hypothetical protein
VTLGFILVNRDTLILRGRTIKSIIYRVYVQGDRVKAIELKADMYIIEEEGKGTNNNMKKEK